MLSSFGLTCRRLNAISLCTHVPWSFFLSFSKIFILAYYRDLKHIFRSPRSVIVVHCRSFLFLVTTNQKVRTVPILRPIERESTVKRNVANRRSKKSTDTRKSGARAHIVAAPRMVKLAPQSMALPFVDPLRNFHEETSREETVR